MTRSQVQELISKAFVPADIAHATVPRDRMDVLLNEPRSLGITGATGSALSHAFGPQYDNGGQVDQLTAEMRRQRARRAA